MKILEGILNAMAAVSWGAFAFLTIRDTWRLERRVEALEDQHEGITDEHVVTLDK